MRPNPLPADYRPYVWALSSAEVAERHGLGREQVLRFDQNTPSFPGVPQLPLAASFAQLSDYPDGTFGELREAAAAYCGVEAEQIVPGAGADELIALCAQTFLAPGRSAAVSPPTYGMYRIATQLQGADVVEDPDGADLIWVCNPNNPTGELRSVDDVAAIAQDHPDAAVVVDEAYWEFAGVTCVPHAFFFGPGYLATLHCIACKERDVPLERLFADVAYVAYSKTVPDINGAVEVSDRPGLGADPEEDMIAKFRV